ncbi:hypothetical protein GCM10011404_13470 [Sphingomonas prati]|nr:hypothetical protein GCM10011404_13470 [Sphingomonas prati]
MLADRCALKQELTGGVGDAYAVAAFDADFRARQRRARSIGYLARNPAFDRRLLACANRNGRVRLGFSLCGGRRYQRRRGNMRKHKAASTKT